MAVSGRGLYVWTGTEFVKTGRKVDAVTPPDPGVDFIYGFTEPFNSSPQAPRPSANVGWDGNSSGGVFNGDQTVPANTTWSNRIIHGNVTLTDSTSKLVNCYIDGSAFAGNKPGLVMVGSGGSLTRCTIMGTSVSVSYYTNGINHTGGTLTVDRCVVQRVIDCVHTSGSTAKLISKGNLYGRYALFTNDANHADDTVRAYWTHNDAIQILSGVGPHVIIGDKIEAFFETAGVVWSGGAWGSGTASGGVIGMPAEGLNAGYYNTYHELGTWANGLTFSNTSGYIVSIERCWIDGVNANSGMIQFTTGTTNQITLKGNRFGLSGKASASNRMYLISYQSGNSVTIGTGADANVFGEYISVPPSQRGTALTFGAGGVAITPSTSFFYANDPEFVGLTVPRSSLTVIGDVQTDTSVDMNTMPLIDGVRVMDGYEVFGTVLNFSYQNSVIKNSILHGCLKRGTLNGVVQSNNDNHRGLKFQNVLFEGRAKLANATTTAFGPIGRQLSNEWISAMRGGNYRVSFSEIRSFSDLIILTGYDAGTTAADGTKNYGIDVHVDHSWLHDGWFNEWTQAEYTSGYYPYAGSYYTHTDGFQFSRGRNFTCRFTYIGGAPSSTGLTHWNNNTRPSQKDLINANDDIFNSGILIKQEEAGQGKLLENITFEYNCLEGCVSSENIVTSDPGLENSFTTTYFQNNRFKRGPSGQVYMRNGPNLGNFVNNVMDDTGDPAPITRGF